MSAVKEELGLGDPQAGEQGSTEQADQFRAAFQAESTVINECLQFTAAHAEETKHDPPAGKRDTTCSAYQVALGRIDPTDPAVAQAAIDQVMAAVQGLKSTVEALKQAVEQAYEAWKAQEGDLDEIVDKIREMVEWGYDKATALQQIADMIAVAANSKKWEEALQALEQLLAKFTGIYDEFCQQKAAKDEYDAALAELESKLGEVATCEFASLEARSMEITTAADQMRQTAESKDYCGALEQLRGLEQQVADYLTDLEDLRAKKDEYDQTREELNPRLTEASTSQYESLAELDQQIADMTTQMEEAAAADEYDRALNLANELSAKVDEKLQRVVEIEEAKAEYEQARGELDSRLGEASTSQYESLAELDQQIADLTTRMEEAAGCDDYPTAMQLLNELSAKVDEKLQRVAEIEQAKAEYEQARAQLDPQLTEASTSEHAALAELDQQIADQTTRMEEAAAAQDYEAARDAVNDLSSLVDEKLQRVAEIEEAKAEYEAALASVQPRLAEASECLYPSLAPLTEEIATIQTEMETAATEQDWERARDLCNDLGTKIDAYVVAKQDLEQEHQQKCTEAQGAIADLKAHAQAAHFTAEIGAAETQFNQAKSQGDSNQLQAAIDLFLQVISTCSEIKITMDLVATGLDRARAEEVADVSQSLIDTGVDRAKAVEVGQVMETGGSGTVEDSKVVAEQVAELPMDVIQEMRANGTSVVACRDSVTDHIESLRGEEPRNWDNGETWDTVPGLFDPNENEVVIATRGHGTEEGVHVPPTNDGHGAYDLVTHEAMHGYDHNGGGTPHHDDPDFVAARQADYGALDDYYSEEQDDAGLEETYAESAARYYDGDPTLRTEWPHLYEYWHDRETRGADGG
ncbi:hypothetical protein OAS39_06480 [Pirellulales bacterium]|nr:hypothetical protein [Pirellulales bacterium]